MVMHTYNSSPGGTEKEVHSFINFTYFSQAMVSGAFKSQHSGGRGLCVSVSLKSAWSAERVPG